MDKNDNEQEPWLSRNLTKVLAAIVFIAVLAAAMSASIYYYHLGGLPISNTDPEDWGQVGDYFGGMLNPVFGFLTILALVITLIQQSRELKLSREELELSRTELRNSAEALRGQNKSIDRQSFEQTFFAWLNTYRESLSSFEYSARINNALLLTARGSEAQKEYCVGKTALVRCWKLHLNPSQVWEKSKLSISRLANQPITQSAKDSLGLLQAGEYGIVSKIASEQWEGLYVANEYQLDSLFRVLYRLIVWIDSQDEERLSSAQKWLYVSIVRAQLSWIELVYLFYNGHTKQGKSFKRLAEKYALFDNLNFATDPVIAIVKACPPDTLGYQPSAYDSKLARVAMGLPESSEQTLAMASDQ